MAFDFISKHFPSPKFLKPKHIGISFSDSEIKAVMFDGKPSKNTLKSTTIPIEKGWIVEGKIVNSDEVAKKLGAIKEDFKNPFVFFTIPDELVYIFSIKLPVSKSGDMTEGVAFTMEENAPLSLADAVFDFTPTGITKSGSQFEASFVVAASLKNEVDKFVQTIYKSGFDPIGCIHDSQATASSIIPKGQLENSCIIHAKENRVAIFLVKEGIVYFSTIRSILEGDYKQQMLDEYERFLEYASKYDTNQGGTIKNVFVCGDFDYSKKAVEAIANSSLSTKNIKLANVWTNILKIEKDTPEVTYEDSLSLAAPVGAIISDIT